MNTDIRHHAPLVVLSFFLIIVSATAFLWYLKILTRPAQPIAIVPADTETESQTAEAAADTSVSAPVTNPIDGAYKNPFE